MYLRYLLIFIIAKLSTTHAAESIFENHALDYTTQMCPFRPYKHPCKEIRMEQKGIEAVLTSFKSNPRGRIPKEIQDQYETYLKAIQELPIEATPHDLEGLKYIIYSIPKYPPR